MNLGMQEMIFLAILGLLLFGPRKLPEIGRQVGKALNEFKRASNEFKSQLDAEVRQLELEAETAGNHGSGAEANKILPPAGTMSRVPMSTEEALIQTESHDAESSVEVSAPEKNV